MPTQPMSAAQVAVRASLSSLSVGWRSLDNGTQDAWRSYASSHPRTDSLGQTVFLTGAQTYIAVNARQLGAGLAVLSAVPIDAVVPTPTVTQAAIGANTLDLTIDAAPGAGSVVQVWASPPLSRGVNFNGDYRLITNTPAPAADDSILTAADLAAKFGALEATEKFFFRVVVVAVGNASAPLEFSVVLTA